jgi:hypothetical protein
MTAPVPTTIAVEATSVALANETVKFGIKTMVTVESVSLAPCTVKFAFKRLVTVKVIPLTKKTVHKDLTFGLKDTKNAIWLKLSFWRGLARGSLHNVYEP